MTLSFGIFLLITAALLALLVAGLRNPRKTWRKQRGNSPLEEARRRNATYMPPIRQALSSADIEYLVAKSLPELARRLRKERLKIALQYLSALRQDFHCLMRLARVIATLSPEVDPLEEFESLRLSLKFRFYYQLIRIRLYAGLVPVPQFSRLSSMLSTLNVRMETAMRELGERAALAAEMASSLEGSGLHTP
jgi:hypothetical protein